MICLTMSRFSSKVCFIIALFLLGFLSNFLGALHILKNYRDTLKRQGKTQRNIATVTGATPEAVAAQKKINADAYGDVISNISSQSSRLKDNALNRYTDTNNYLLGQKSNMYAQRAQNFSNLAANGVGLLTSSLQNIGNSMDKSIGNFFKR